MSKKIENPSVQAVIYFVSVFIISVILFPLLDLFWTGVITHSDFHYSPNDYIIEPLIFAVIMTAVFYAPMIIKHNKNSKEKTKKK